MGITERKERDKRKMERSILDAAMKLFVDDGYEKVSIRRIAEMIEYSPATIYVYFKDKDEILYRLHEEGFKKLFEQQMEVQSIADPMQRLRKHAAAYVDFGLKNSQYYELMFIMTAQMRKVESDDWECSYESYDILKQNIQECVDAGAFDIEDIDVATISLWVVVHGLVSLIIRDRFGNIGQGDMDGLIRATIDYTLRR